MTPKEMAEKRIALTREAQGLIDKAANEKRSLAAAEDERIDKIFAEVDGLRTQIDAAEKSETRTKRLDDEKRWADQTAGRRTAAVEPVALGGGNKPAVWNATDEYRSAYSRFLRGGARVLGADEYRLLQGPEELRALQADADVAGGFLVAPQQMVNDLVKFKDNLVFMRGLATKYTVNGAGSLGAPSLDADPADSNWTAEILTGAEDSTMAFGKRELFPKPLAKRIKVSRTLLNRTANGAESLVRDRLGYKQAVTEEQAFLTGTGAGQPLGVFVASASGISTGRDVSTDNTTTNLTADGLINAKFSLKAPYMASPSVRWIFHRTAVRNIRKLKDGNGQYLWAAGLGGKPDTILEVSYAMSEYAPSTFTTGLYVGIIGDFSFYWIADALNLQIQRLDELYAETNQVGFIGRSETDGMPVLEEAFARVKLA
ncbi:MAG TPA: phage major capsid protein [Actinomycetota bacterium]